MSNLTGDVIEWIIIVLVLVIALLIVAVLSLEHMYHDKRNLAERALQHLEIITDDIINCGVESGVCCCGDNMHGHSDAYTCGHTPTDIYGHYGIPRVYAAQEFIKDVRRIS